MIDYQPHPLRIQRKRTKDWRMPEGAVYVGRPSKWGNPFRRFGENEYLYCDASHRRTALTPWVIFDQHQDIEQNPVTTAMIREHYARWLRHEFDDEGVVRPCSVTDEDLASLRGKQLACWCGLDKWCHADTLAEIVNQ